MKIKIFLIALFVPILYIIILNPQQSLSSLSIQDDTYLTYESSNFGFKVEYPSNWTYIENPVSGVVVSFIVEDSNPESFETPWIDIKVRENNDSFVIPTIEQIQYLLRQYSRYASPNSKIVESSITILPNTGYKVINQTYFINEKIDAYNNIILKGMNFIIKYENRIYAIDYYISEKNFEKYLPIFNILLSSFKITNSEIDISKNDTTIKDVIKENIKQSMKQTYGLENPFYIINSDSMEPYLKKNDIVTVSGKVSFNDLKSGDVIAFKKPSDINKIIISRIIKIDIVNGEKIITTKGDTNNISVFGTDYPIKEENYIGKIVSGSSFVNPDLYS